MARSPLFVIEARVAVDLDKRSGEFRWSGVFPGSLGCDKGGARSSSREGFENGSSVHKGIVPPDGKMINYLGGNAMGCLNTFMSEPKRDHGDVYSRLQQMHCRRGRSVCGAGIADGLLQNAIDALGREWFTSRARKSERVQVSFVRAVFDQRGTARFLTSFACSWRNELARDAQDIVYFEGD